MTKPGRTLCLLLTFLLITLSTGCNGRARVRSEMKEDVSVVMEALSASLNRELTFDNEIRNMEEPLAELPDLFTELEDMFAGDDFIAAFERLIVNGDYAPMSDDEEELMSNVISAYSAYSLYYSKVMEKMLLEMLGVEGVSATDITIIPDNAVEGLGILNAELLRMQEMSLEELIAEFDDQHREIRQMIDQ